MRTATTLLFALGLTLVSGSALARGVMISPTHLPAAHRGTLVAQIDAARATDPTAFTLVSTLRAQVAALDAGKRGRLAAITPSLKAMGPRVLMPMLHELAVDASPRGGLPDTAWLAWQLALLESIGSLRDARAEPVLTAVLEHGPTDFALVRAAAGALGKLGTDSAAKKLVALSRKASPRQVAVLAGMGHCRRAVVADRLAEAITTAPDGRVVKLLARSLGDVGNAWAWETPVVAASGEAAATRGLAAQALVTSFVAFGHDDVRTALTQAILVVDDPSTLGLIAEQRKGADAELRGALDRLEQRFANSPLR